jgi:hypothetical protein
MRRYPHNPPRERAMQGETSLVPLKLYELHPALPPAIRFYGRQLLVEGPSPLERLESKKPWYSMTLYCGANGHLRLYFEYRPAAHSSGKHEPPFRDVIQGQGFCSIADAMAQYDFIGQLQWRDARAGRRWLRRKSARGRSRIVVGFQFLAAKVLERIATRANEWHELYGIPWA